jgi:hypothetical protein
MDRLSRFLHLSRAERTLLLQATILMAAIRLGLSTLRFARLRTLLARLAATGLRRADRAPLRSSAAVRSVWAVETVGHHFPLIGTCLTQALAAHVLLARRGHESNLRIGVTRDGNGKFVAHAWLEKEGAILIGGTWSKSYTPMPVLNGLEL